MQTHKNIILSLILYLGDYVHSKLRNWISTGEVMILFILLDFWLSVKAAPHECVIRTSQHKT